MKRLLTFISILCLCFATTASNLVFAESIDETTVYSSIVGIGDSWAQGVATPGSSSTERTYIKQASNTLGWNDHYYNGAYGGWFTDNTLTSIKTTEEGNTNYISTHNAILDADVIVCHVGTNDMRSPINYIPGTALGKNNTEASAYLQQQANNSKNTTFNRIKQIINYIRGYRPSALIVLSGVYCNYENVEDNCASINENMSDTEKKEIYTTAYDYYVREATKELNQNLAALQSSDNNLVYFDDDKVIGKIDNYSQTSAQSGNPNYNQGHPTDTGYKKMGEELVRLIRDFYKTDYPAFDHDTKIDLSMVEGASIRLGNVNGIRFYTNVDKDKVSKLKANGYTVEMGTLIAPDDYLLNRPYQWDTKQQLTFNIDESQYINVPYDSNDYYENKNMNFSGIVGSIVNLKEIDTNWSKASGNITRNFVARGYAKVIKDGKVLSISYSDNYYDNTKRSLKTVASAFKASGDMNNYSSEVQNLVTKWAMAEK